MSENPNLSGAWIPVSSSWIHAARYDRLRGVLQVQVRRQAKVYDCPASAGLALAFFGAASKGTFFNQHLRLER